MIVVQGQHGTVTGPADGEGYFEKGTGVQVRFPGHTGSINCLLTEVRRLRTASVANPRLRTTGTLPTPRAFPRQPLPRRPDPIASAATRAVAQLPRLVFVRR